MSAEKAKHARHVTSVLKTVSVISASSTLNFLCFTWDTSSQSNRLVLSFFLDCFHTDQSLEVLKLTMMMLTVEKWKLDAGLF